MWPWLSWLYDQSSKVYNLVASFYTRIINAARNAWTWAENAKNKAIAWAYDNIIIYYYKARNLAKGWVQDAKNLAYLLYYKTIAAAKDLFAGVGDLIKIALKRAEVFAQGLVNGAINLAWVLYWRAVEAAQAILAGVLGIIAATVDRAYQTLVVMINGVVDMIDAKLKAIGIVDPESEGQLRLFLTNPMGWFAAYLVSILLTALAYTTAYALGTVEATLPPPPEWSVNGAGGPYPPGPAPLPGASPLALPLSYLRRSGYPYSPSHRAADFGCTQDMKVYACHDGRVLVSGWSNVGYGYYVVIGNGEWWSLYAHLLPPIVTTGQNVSARQALGVCDTTGNSTGNHLHLELKHYGSFVSPYVVFGVEG